MLIGYTTAIYMVKIYKKLRLRPMWALENVVLEIIIPHGLGKRQYW